jgi:hypothetical protein
MNPTQKGHVVEMSKEIPESETDRTEEAQDLVAMIAESDHPKLTTWEMQTVNEVREGKASTKLRLRELRQIVKRLQT